MSEESDVSFKTKKTVYQQLNATLDELAVATEMRSDSNGSPGPIRKNVFESRISIAEKQTKERRKKRSYDTKVYKRLIGYSLREWKILIIANICLVLSAGGQMLIPLYGGKIIDVISDESSQRSGLNSVILVILVISAISSLFSLLRTYFFGLIGERVMKKLFEELFEAIIDKDVEFFDTTKTGELLSRLNSDTYAAQYASADNLSNLIRNLLTSAASLVILFSISWKLSMVLILIVPPIVGSIVMFSLFNKRLQKQYQDAIAATNNVAAEAFNNIRIVKAFSTEDKEKKFFLQRLDYSYLLGRKKSRVKGVFMGFLNFVSYSGIVGIIWYGGNLVLNGELTSGQLSSFMIYSVTLSGAVAQIGQAFDKITVAIGACEKMFGIIDRKPKIITNKGKTIPEFGGQIDIKNVNFEYPTKPGVQVLRDFSLKIKPGDVIAVCGASGSGKTSLVSLIERFYDPREGEISVDGESLQNINLKWYHENIGYVSQEPSLFSGTIEENIVYGVNNYTEAELQQAMEMANAAEFINNRNMFPEGLNTIVGERGVKLSGGQKQRVAIARALIKNPKILIFDEATSALDAESEHLVQSAIDALIKDKSKTVIIIAHRLSTIINCPRIIVMKDGKIAEEGNHYELLEKNGIYRALIERQLSGYQI